MGGVHGDEPEGVELAKKTLEWLKTQSPDDVAPWILIPCLNKDGFANQTRVNGRGVDLNRNYPSSDWQPAAAKERYNPGPQPMSEPEIQGVVELIETFRPRLVIHCHSWKPMIVYTGEPGKKDSERLGQSSGYEVNADIGYPTPGSLGQYGWSDLKIPVICIEEQDELSELSPIWPRFAEGIKAIFRDKSLRK
jgi:protein MpaA